MTNDLQLLEGQENYHKFGIEQILYSDIEMGRDSHYAKR